MTSNDNASDSSTIYCTSCGEEIPATAKFCPNCGDKKENKKMEKAENENDTPDSGDTPKLRHRLPGISNKNTTRRNVIIGTGYTFLGLSILGAASPNNEGTENRKNDNNRKTTEEELFPNAWYYDNETEIIIEDPPKAEFDSIGTLYIRGTATNKSGKDYSYVQLSWAIYDNSGAKIADGLANTAGLDAGQSWRFEAFAMGAETADSYELADVTAY